MCITCAQVVMILCTTLPLPSPPISSYARYLSPPLYPHPFRSTDNIVFISDRRLWITANGGTDQRTEKRPRTAGNDERP